MKRPECSQSYRVCREVPWFAVLRLVQGDLFSPQVYLRPHQARLFALPHAGVDGNVDSRKLSPVGYLGLEFRFLVCAEVPEASIFFRDAPVAESSVHTYRKKGEELGSRN